MKISRRDFGKSLLSLCFMPGVGVSSLTTTHHTPALSTPQFFASASKGQDNQYWLQVVDSGGRQTAKLALPARAHQVVAHPFRKWVLVVARRPGHYIKVYDYQEGVTLFNIQPKAGYHFYGHAVFSPDGKFFVTAENDIEKGQGRLVVRDVESDFIEVADYPSYGIGPHQLSFLSDQKTLVVANGGILTHPDRGREKLNLDTMTPSLDYIDFKTGALLEKRVLDRELYQLSIRHLAVNKADKVTLVMQYQGSVMDNPPLVGTHRQGEAIKLLSAPEAVNRSMKHYCGSVSIDDSGHTAAVSSPKGNIVTIWDIKQGQFLDHFRCTDACGIASAGDGRFVISTGTGRFYHYDVSTRTLSRKTLRVEPTIIWDNHLTSL